MLSIKEAVTSSVGMSLAQRTNAHNTTKASTVATPVYKTWSAGHQVHAANGTNMVCECYYLRQLLVVNVE